MASFETIDVIDVSDEPYAPIFNRFDGRLVERVFNNRVVGLSSDEKCSRYFYLCSRNERWQRVGRLVKGFCCPRSWTNPILPLRQVPGVLP